MFTVSIKGLATSDTTTTSTLVSLRNYSTANPDGTASELWSDTTAIQSLLDAVQPVTSASITDYSYQFGTRYYSDGTPAAPMDSSELFTDDFSDVTVVPTLTIKLSADTASRDYMERQDCPAGFLELYSKSFSFALKYVTDPASADFNTNVQDFIDKIQNLPTRIMPYGSSSELLSGKVTFTVDEDIEG